MKCPICGADAGDYRLGACSADCDFVIGDDVSFAPVLAVLLVAVSIVAFFLWLVLR